MPVTITNTTQNELPLNDLGIVPIPASGSFVLPHTETNRHRLMFSKDLKAALKDGSVSIEYDSIGADDNYDPDVVVFTDNPGHAHLAGKLRMPEVSKTSGPTVLKPTNPDDGDIIFSPLHRLEFYWDATRQKWLSVSVFDMTFTKGGALTVGDYLSLYNVCPDLGANLPLDYCLVTVCVMTCVSGTGDASSFVLSNNGADIYTVNVAQGVYNSYDLTTNVSVPPGDLTSVGLRARLDAVPSGTPPTDALIAVTYRLELV